MPVTNLYGMERANGELKVTPNLCRCPPEKIAYEVFKESPTNYISIEGL